MRYTKIALLTFGAGMLLALIVVAAEIDRLQRVASIAMALGIAAIPIGMAIDWRLAMRAPRHSAKRRGRPRRPPHATAARRVRPRRPPRPSRRQ